MKGNVYAQRHSIRIYDQAERERRLEIAEEIEVWEKYIAWKRQEIADSIAKGEPASDPLPHPDDVVLDHENGVRFIGPVTERKMEQPQDTLRLRDILIMQDALDERLAPATQSDDPLDQPGSAMCFARYLNENVPERFKLSEAEMLFRNEKYWASSKRKLLKDLYQSWRKYGLPAPRGFTFPPLRFGKTRLEIMPELLESVFKTTRGEYAPHEFEERFVEFFSRMRDRNASS